ncbi:MAG: glycoside hydrolase family 32 protein [Oscillibacter sp.]|nr:glycoside hydrolase family 32 protein [Oscillibacter sp.]
MNRSYRPRYHASVMSGWANDPNGTIFYGGKAHLFYQHYPHKAEWGTMHWGHFTTEDFVRWENLPITLVPDQDYEVICGCCSGSTIEKDGKLYLMYTAAQPDLQRQCVAVSGDGVHFEKDPGNPILTADMLNPEVSRTDFRDPRMFRKGDWYYMIAGARVLTPEEAARDPNGGYVQPPPDTLPGASPSEGHVSEGEPPKTGYGNMILARSRDLYHWEYVGHLIHEQPEYDLAYYRLNGVYECPDYFTDNGEEVLLSSPQNLPRMGNRYQNIHSSLYMLGKLSFETGRFDVRKIEEIDAGFDFYAAQTLRVPDGRVIMIAWKEMWDRSFPTRPEGWAGTYTLPRELTVRDGWLIQKPVREIAAYRRNPVSRDSLAVEDASVSVDGISGDVIELRVTLAPGTASKSGLKLFKGGEHETLLYYDRAQGTLVFDRGRAGRELEGREKDVVRRYLDVGQVDALELDLYLDVCSLEVFVDGGKRTMTGNVYPDVGTDVGVEFFAEGGACEFRSVEKYDIVV